MSNRQAGAQEVFGHNTDVSYRGRTFHVQTENLGVAEHPTINTLVYHEGSLLNKVTSSYADLGDSVDQSYLDKLKERVKQQHLKVLGGIKKGEIP